MTALLVQKADGSLEPLNYEKVRDALTRAGASRGLAEEVIESIQSSIHPGITTSEIYSLAFSALRELRPGAAARFALKSALLRLGPEGYPFETFMGSLLKGRGYSTQLRQIVRGHCISHEIDVIATRPAIPGHAPTRAIVECKFHNASYMRCHAPSALYSWARFLDVQAANPEIDSVWLATNTKFTTDTIAYGDCMGLKLLGWSFPAEESIQVRIEEHQLYPTTVLHALNRRQFLQLHEAGIILVKELLDAPQERLKEAGLSEHEIEKLQEQARAVLSKKG
ncbi:ATP cone domain protein [uncultured archaeon]|nr:ATP cone domain protein [uncultured archaeon]